MHTVGGTKSAKSRLGNGWVGLVLCAGSLAWFGCGSDKDDGADTEVDALKPAEPTQLLSYSCRQDAALERRPLRNDHRFDSSCTSDGMSMPCVRAISIASG